MPHAVSDGSTPRLMPKWEDTHPWLISAVAVISLGAMNAKWLSPSDVFVVLGQALVTITAGFLGLLLLRRSAAHAALLTSWIGLWTSYYGVLFDELRKLPTGGFPELRHAVLIAIGLGVAAVLWCLTGDFRRLSKFVCLTLAITLSVYSAKFGMALTTDLKSSWNTSKTSSSVTSSESFQEASHPDIYYIILDGYGRKDVLQESYGFDNTEFLDGLRQRGFYVADKSTTNYIATVYSLSSSLNMRYHESISPVGGYKPLAAMVRAHEVGQCLADRGYKLIHFNTHFMPTACSDIAHISLGESTNWLPAGTRMLTLSMIHHSVFRFINGGDFGMYAAQHRRALSQLAEVPTLPGPKFTFCHLVTPHPPFVFNREGQTNWQIDQTNRDAYVDQVIYLNREVTRIIDSILAKSRVAPIIIVQSDHGPGFFRAKSGSDRNADEVTERVPILNAYLVPDSMRESLYPTITPVNTFRLLLAQCFEFDRPLLPDRNFVIHRLNPLKVSDVTEKVHDGTPEPGLRRPD